MEFEDKIKENLLLRGFSEKTIINHRGLIGAVIDETILLSAKKHLNVPDLRFTISEKCILPNVDMRGNCFKCGKHHSEH